MADTSAITRRTAPVARDGAGCYVRAATVDRGVKRVELQPPRRGVKAVGCEHGRARHCLPGPRVRGPRAAAMVL